MVKNPPASANIRDVGSILGWEDPLEKGMATDSSIFAWRILRTEELGITVHRVTKSQLRLK